MPARAEEELGLHLHNWLEAQVLRREAEALIQSEAPRNGRKTGNAARPRNELDLSPGGSSTEADQTVERRVAADVMARPRAGATARFDRIDACKTGFSRTTARTVKVGQALKRATRKKLSTLPSRHRPSLARLATALLRVQQLKIDEVIIILPAACRMRWAASSPYRLFGFRHRPHNTSRKNDRHDPSLHCKLPGLPK
jgi:hypothetical protein